MRYPNGSCGDCGERLYGTADGALFCPNCGNYVEAPPEEPAEAEPSEPVSEAS